MPAFFRSCYAASDIVIPVYVLTEPRSAGFREDCATKDFFSLRMIVSAEDSKYVLSSHVKFVGC